MRQAFLKSLVLVLSIISVSSFAAAQDQANSDSPTQNESTTRDKRVKKSKYFDRFETINTHLVGSSNHQIQIAGRYTGAQITATSNNATTQAELYNNQTTMTGGFQYLYGLMNNINLGADLSYASSSFESVTYTGTTETASKSESKGLSGVNVRAQLGFDLGGVGLYTDASYSPRIGTASRNNVTNEENNAPEQATFSLKNSMVLNSGGTKYGGYLYYTHNFEGETESINATTTTVRKVTGGSSAAIGAFAEFAEFNNLNLRVGLINSAGKTYTNQNGTLNTDNPSIDYINAAAAFDIKISNTFSVLPEAEYVTVLNRNRDTFTFDQVHVYALTLSLRKIF